MRNLQREAQSRGIAADRLRFSPLLPRMHSLARMRHADMFLDSTRVSATKMLVDALSLGVPAISCAWQQAGTHALAHALQATGLSDQGVGSKEAYLEAAIQLASDAALRNRLKADLATFNRLTLPAFRQSATREIEAAWITAVERSRSAVDRLG